MMSKFLSAFFENGKYIRFASMQTCFTTVALLTDEERANIGCCREIRKAQTQIAAVVEKGISVLCLFHDRKISLHGRKVSFFLEIKGV